MPFFFLFLLIRILFVVAVFMLSAWAIAEYFPVFADKALAVSNGTEVELFGEWVAKALRVAAKYARMFMDVVFGWVEYAGIDTDRLKSAMEDNKRPSI